MNLGPSHPSTRASIQFSTISGIRITGRYTGKPHVANSYVDVDANDPGSWNKSLAEGGYERCGMWSGQQVRRPLLRFSFPQPRALLLQRQALRQR